MRKSNWPIPRIGGREGFTPLIYVSVFPPFSQLTEYSYLPKYPLLERQFGRSNGHLSSTSIDLWPPNDQHRAGDAPATVSRLKEGTKSLAGKRKRRHRSSCSQPAVDPIGLIGNCHEGLELDLPLICGDDPFLRCLARCREPLLMRQLRVRSSNR
jgi:hypothetical protein